MTYSTIEELELIGRQGVVNYTEKIGGINIIKCRCLSSFWLCTLPVKDGIAEHLQNDGYWESWVTKWISNNVMPGSVCIDAGATYGYYTFFLAQHGCKVYSIEINNELIPLLEYANYLNGSWDRVHILHKAASNITGHNIIYRQEDYLLQASADKTFSGKTVETFALDDLLKIEKKIDFIKLDIGGAEQLTLLGMKQIMKTNPGCICIMEFTPSYYDNYGKEFFNFLVNEYKVSFINNDSIEMPVHGNIETIGDNTRMLIIRNKFTDEPATNLISILQNID